MNNLNVTTVILEQDEQEKDFFEREKNTGLKRVLHLSKVPGVPETRENLSSSDDLLLGIQTASSMHGCPFCESYNGNEEEKNVNTSGK